MESFEKIIIVPNQKMCKVASPASTASPHDQKGAKSGDATAFLGTLLHQYSLIVGTLLRVWGRYGDATFVSSVPIRLSFGKIGWGRWGRYFSKGKANGKNENLVKRPFLPTVFTY